MLSFKFKKNLLTSLISVAIILLAANILLQPNLFRPRNDEEVINKNEISQKFKKILKDFGIEDKFIKENNSINNASKREFAVFKIQVPKDLSIPEILQAIFISFRKDSLTFNSVEKIKGGKTILTLNYENLILLKAEFDYSKNYLRNAGFFAFIIENVDPANSSSNSLIESPTKLNFLIRPESAYLQYLEFIKNNAQQFSILIDDEIKEQKYQLGPGFSEKRVIDVVKTLVTDFQQAVCFVVDDNSDFYKSTSYEIFKRELSKRNIKVFTSSHFVNLKNDENISSVFDEKLYSLNNGESIIFLLDEETYLALNSEIIKYLKKGYRVISSSLIL